MESINTQKPATKNQITNNKPSIFKNANLLQGYIANSINGGFIKPVAYKQIMAGEEHGEYRFQACLRMLTPKTPVFQKLKATFKAYFVPNSRVWTNAEKFTAQKGGSTVSKIKEVPNIGGKKIPWISVETDSEDEDAVNNVPLTDTDIWRNMWASGYLPKWETGHINAGTGKALPKYSVLPFRGFKAIYNDYERNKEYDEELTEYKADTVSNLEFYSIFGNSGETIENNPTQYMIRGKRQNSYFTDYRTEMLGDDIAEPISGTNDLINFTEWEKKVAEMRSEAENAQLNDWDIIAKIRGSKPLTEGKVQLLGVKTVGLNYQAVSQTAYNVNNDISEEFQQLGEQGAYSYTEIDIPLYHYVKFNEEGYLHIIMQITADSVFETGFERTGLNVSVLDQYRPDMKDVKHDVLYRIEKDGARSTAVLEDIMAVDGYKRKYSELFKLPTVIAGDMTTGGAYQTETKFNELQGEWKLFLKASAQRLQSKHTFQFFEIDDRYTNEYYPKKIWKDYTDILINKNQGIKNEIIEYQDFVETKEIMVAGANQVFFVGMCSCIANLPVDENIRNNYTVWGEK